MEFRHLMLLEGQTKLDKGLKIKLPEHGVNGRIGSAGPVVVDKLGDELLGAAAAIVHQLQRGLAVIERKAAPDEDSEFS